jgi:hypothetical protein
VLLLRQDVTASRPTRFLVLIPVALYNTPEPELGTPNSRVFQCGWQHADMLMWNYPDLDSQGWLVPASQQIIKGCDDFITLFLQRPNQFAEFLFGDRNDFERMQDNPLAFDSESWIEPEVGNLSERRFIDQRNHDPATVIVIEGRLHNHDERDAVAVPSRIAMDVELSHQRVE